MNNRTRAANPNTPTSVLLTLATDADRYVREGVARNPSTPLNVLRTLATDADKDVRYSVALNPSTPANALRTLATDAGRYVRRTAVRSLQSHQTANHALNVILHHPITRGLNLRSSERVFQPNLAKVMPQARNKRGVQNKHPIRVSENDENVNRKRRHDEIVNRERRLVGESRRLRKRARNASNNAMQKVKRANLAFYSRPNHPLRKTGKYGDFVRHLIAKR